MIEDYFGKVINPAEEFTYGEVERQGVVIFGGSPEFRDRVRPLMESYKIKPYAPSIRL